MRVVVLTSYDAIDAYLVQSLRSKCDDLRVLELVWPPRTDAAPARSPWSRVTPANVARRVREIVRERRSRRTTRETSEILFGGPDVPRPGDVEEVVAWNVNDVETIARLRALNPDFLVVAGAPILDSGVLEAPSVAAVNVHYGVAPAYRGEDTIFWPLYFGDFDNVGVTLHLVDDRIDGGEVLAHGFPALEPGDTEATVTAKCARMAAALTVEIVDWARRAPVMGEAQGGPGTMYFKRHRTIWRDLHYQMLRRLGRRSPLVRDERIVRYYARQGTGRAGGS